MAKLVWDQTGERLYETGVRNAVIYPQDAQGEYPQGFAWNGITAVNENPSGADPTDLYADDMLYLSIRAAEKFGASIEAYMYPDEFAVLDGSVELREGVYIYQQDRKAFGLCYRTTLGNDTEFNDHGFKLHLVYGCTVSPTSRSYSTINESPEAITFSWEMTTIPVSVTDHKPTSLLVIDSTQFTSQTDKDKLEDLMDILYGTDNEDPRLPLPDEVLQKLS